MIVDVRYRMMNMILLNYSSNAYSFQTKYYSLACIGRHANEFTQLFGLSTFFALRVLDIRSKYHYAAFLCLPNTLYPTNSRINM